MIAGGALKASVVSQSFGNRADGYSTSEVHRGSPTLERLHQLVLHHAGFPPRFVVDVGCGPGAAGLRFVHEDVTIVALDGAASMLSAAAAAAPPIAEYHTIRSFAEDVPLPSGCADLVVSRLAAHHFQDLFAALTEMRRVTRSGGLVGVIDLVAPEDARLADINHQIEMLHDPTHVRTRSLSSWSSAFARVGLDLLHADGEQAERPVGVSLARWCEIAATPPENVPQIQRLLMELSDAARREIGWALQEGELVCRVRTALLCAAVIAS